MDYSLGKSITDSIIFGHFSMRKLFKGTISRPLLLN